MSNVVISGYYGSKNAGDEAMLAAMVEVLSDLDPKVNITVISFHSENLLELFIYWEPCGMAISF